MLNLLFPEILSFIRSAKSGLKRQTAPGPATVCPSCMSPLCSQMTVFECSMGHLTCRECREGLKRCTECGTEFGWRGVSMEQVIRRWGRE